MENNNSSTSNTTRQNRINQLKIQIQMLEEQLEASKRDLKELQRQENQ